MSYLLHGLELGFVGNAMSAAIGGICAVDLPSFPLSLLHYFFTKMVYLLLLAVLQTFKRKYFVHWNSLRRNFTLLRVATLLQFEVLSEHPWIFYLHTQGSLLRMLYHHHWGLLHGAP